MAERERGNHTKDVLMFVWCVWRWFRRHLPTWSGLLEIGEEHWSRVHHPGGSPCLLIYGILRATPVAPSLAGCTVLVMDLTAVWTVDQVSAFGLLFWITVWAALNTAGCLWWLLLLFFCCYWMLLHAGILLLDTCFIDWSLPSVLLVLWRWWVVRQTGKQRLEWSLWLLWTPFPHEGKWWVNEESPLQLVEIAGERACECCVCLNVL